MAAVRDPPALSQARTIVAQLKSLGPAPGVTEEPTPLQSIDQAAPAAVIPLYLFDSAWGVSVAEADFQIDVGDGNSAPADGIQGSGTCTSLEDGVEEGGGAVLDRATDLSDVSSDNNVLGNFVLSSGVVVEVGEDMDSGLCGAGQSSVVDLVG